MEELLGGPGHPPPVAPRAREEARAPVPPARSPSPRSLDQAADPPPGPREPQVGLPQDQGRAPEARRRRLGHDHRHGASPRRTRPRAPTNRTDLDAVPPAAGVRPALSRRAVRGGPEPCGTGGGPATGEAGPAR